MKAGSNLDISEIDVEAQSNFRDVLVYTVAAYLCEGVTRQIYVKVAIYPLRIEENQHEVRKDIKIFASEHLCEGYLVKIPLVLNYIILRVDFLDG